MAISHPLTTPTADRPSRRTRQLAWIGASRRTRLLAWIAGGTVLVALLTALAIAVWPASETDKARADGEAYGAAVADLYAADTPEEVDAGLSDMRTAAADTREHAGDRVAQQVDDQADALYRAADGYVGSQTGDSEFDRDLYQAELEVAKDDLVSQADDFRTAGPEVQRAFWEGFDTGLDGA
jgi:hypothetical protein